MHNNYYFLKHLSNQLKQSLIGLTVDACFSQNKNEIIFILNGKEHFIIKADLGSSFSCLTFPDTYHRARKNSIDLFPDVIDKSVVGVTQYLNERSFSIELEDSLSLLFKMHGNRSNVLLFKNGQLLYLFKNNLVKDQNIKIESQNRDLDQSKDAFLANNGDYKALFPTFGKVVSTYLSKIGYEQTHSADEKWNIIQDTLKELNQPKFHLQETEKGYILSLLKDQNTIKTFDDSMNAVNYFFNKAVSSRTLNDEKSKLLQAIEKSINKTKAYIKKCKGKLEALKNRIPYNHIGDLLMANLHTITNEATEITVSNFYDDNKPLTIKLNREWSAQKNAENFYRKSKNQSKERDSLAQNIKSKEMLLLELEIQHEKLSDTSDLKSLRNLGKSIINENTKITETPKPFNAFYYDGFDIWVGKNAKSNDTMLRQYAHKDDLWLHAKDVSGSHVLIKQVSGRSIPEYIIEKAAQLAAFYSKRKTDSLCPVIYTPRKFVRKRKGDPAGAVVVEKEKVVLVVPEKW